MSFPNLTWKSDYEVGVESIDFQHHYFFDLIKRLSVELHEVTDAKHKSYLIAELNAYARFHFISEENLMRRHRYPGLVEHQLHHRELVNQLSAREGKFEFERSGESADEVINFLLEWFFSHTTKEDQLFAKFLHEIKA